MQLCNPLIIVNFARRQGYGLLCTFVAKVAKINKNNRIYASLRAWAINRWKKRGSVIYNMDRKNEANKMFIMWLLPVWGTGNKCRTHDLTVIWQVSKKKVFISTRKQ